MENSCCGGTKLIFSCSGAADVGAVADLAARRLSKKGAGKMFCLAGIGGRVEGIMKTTAEAETILAIDGCQADCVKSTLEQAGFTEYVHVRLSDEGFEKGKTEVTDENVGNAAGVCASRISCC